MTSYQLQLVLPLFAMAFLTLSLLFVLGFKRYMAAKKHLVDPSYYKLYRGDGEPDEIHKIARNVSNLFEVPILFYVAVVLALLLKAESALLIYSAWLFAALRFLHSFIHCNSNKVINRFKVYALSCFVLLIFWITLLIEILMR